MYCGYVVKIKTLPHPNADRLQLATCMGNQVIVGIDVPDESVGIFFPADGCLSKEMLTNNKLRKIDGDETLLRDIVEFRTEGPSTIDPSHIREGVVVRANDSWYKNKSFVFGVLEGYIKDQGEIDMEESA